MVNVVKHGPRKYEKKKWKLLALGSRRIFYRNIEIFCEIDLVIFVEFSATLNIEKITV